MSDAGRYGDRRNLEVPGDPLDLNQASVEQLRMIVGLGEARAEQIIAWRERHGRFRSVDDLQHLPLFGPDLVARVRRRLKV